MKLCAEKPCPTCPWRKSSDVTGNDIPNFSIEKMRGLKNTVAPRGTGQDGFYKIMACHHSKEGVEYACAGYIAREGLNNINVRFMAAENEINIVSIIETCNEIDMYDNFYEMLDSFEKEGC